jgi:hypothetical protein
VCSTLTLSCIIARGTLRAAQVDNSEALWRFSIADQTWSQHVWADAKRGNARIPWPAPREYASIASAGLLFGGITNTPAECYDSEAGTGRGNRLDYLLNIKEIALSGLWQWQDDSGTVFYQ